MRALLARRARPARIRRVRPRTRVCRRRARTCSPARGRGALEQRVADPGDLPGLQERIAEVLADVASEMERRAASSLAIARAPPPAEPRANEAPRGRDAGDATRVSRSRLVAVKVHLLLSERRRAALPRAPDRRSRRTPRPQPPTSVVGTYQAAWRRIVNASACSCAMPRRPSDATPSHS